MINSVMFGQEKEFRILKLEIIPYAGSLTDVTKRFIISELNSDSRRTENLISGADERAKAVIKYLTMT
jgi:hypothetical protein